MERQPLSDMTDRPTVRSLAEMRFAASLMACPKCGAPAPTQLDFYGNDKLWSYVGRCPGCNTPRNFDFRTDGDPMSLPTPEWRHLGGSEPSRILPPYQLLAELERLEPQLHSDPTTLPVESWYAQAAISNRAFTAIVELCKFLPAFEDAIPDRLLGDDDRALRARAPERFTGGWLEQQRARIMARADRFTADAPRVWMIRTGNKLSISEEIRGILNQVTVARVPTLRELRDYLRVRSSDVRERADELVADLPATGDVTRIRAWRDGDGTRAELAVQRGTLEQVEREIGRTFQTASGRRVAPLVAGHRIPVDVDVNAGQVMSVRVWLDEARPSVRARFHLPYNRRYGFGGEFPLKLLFIDDFTGRPSPQPLEDRKPYAVTTASFEKRMDDFRPADDAATRARWKRLRSVIAAVEAVHPAAMIEIWNCSAEDLRCDFEDAPEISSSGLCKMVDAAIYNWPCCPASPPYAALVFGYPLDHELARSVATVSERMCTPVVGVDDTVRMARDIERTGWTLDPYGPDPRAVQFTAWSLLRYLFMLHTHYRARREGLDDRMQFWLDMHAAHGNAADPTRPLLDGTAKLEPGDILHLEATPQPPAGVAERQVEARVKLPYVAESRGLGTDTRDERFDHPMEARSQTPVPARMGPPYDLRTLSRAATHGDLDVIRAWLASGADPNVGDPRSGTLLLHDAAYFKQSQVVEALIQAGANVNAMNRDGRTPVALAVQYPPNLPKEVGMIAGGAFVVRAMPAAPERDVTAQLAIIRMLLHAGAQLNPTPVNTILFDFPLTLAAVEGDPEIVRELLAHGANVNAAWSGSALTEAVNRGHFEIVDLLCSAGADPNLPQRGGDTPLIRSVLSIRLVTIEGERAAEKRGEPFGDAERGAVRAHMRRITARLLAAGADPSHTNRGKTALDHAQREGDPELVALLRGSARGAVGATSTEVEVARRRAIARLEEAARAAAEKSADPYWQHGPFNVQHWVARGFHTAIGVLRAEAPHSGESPREYLSRVSAAVHKHRDHGPDADTEAWYAGAIDQACAMITDDRS